MSVCDEPAPEFGRLWDWLSAFETCLSGDRAAYTFAHRSTDLLPDVGTLAAHGAADDVTRVRGETESPREEPPWSYRIHDDTVTLDVIGTISRFLVRQF